MLKNIFMLLKSPFPFFISKKHSEFWYFVVWCCELVHQIWCSCFMVYIFFMCLTLFKIFLIGMVHWLWYQIVAYYLFEIKKSQVIKRYNKEVTVWYKIYRCAQGGVSGWRAHRVTHKVVKKMCYFDASQLKKYKW